MKRTINFFPGRMALLFRKGPSGRLQQDYIPLCEAVFQETSGSVREAPAAAAPILSSSSGLTQSKLQPSLIPSSATGKPETQSVMDTGHYLPTVPRVDVREGLKDPRMSFEDFAASPFFERELEAAKHRGAEWRKVAEERKKRESAVQLPTGRLCRFCYQPLKQGPSSPHVHSSFPGGSGKYIYCPSRGFSLYKDQGMVTEMTWDDFSQSDFYEAERDRWIAEKK